MFTLSKDSTCLYPEMDNFSYEISSNFYWLKGGYPDALRQYFMDKYLVQYHLCVLFFL